jgi:hypothetical protein
MCRAAFPINASTISNEVMQEYLVRPVITDPNFDHSDAVFGEVERKLLAASTLDPSRIGSLTTLADLLIDRCKIENAKAMCCRAIVAEGPENCAGYIVGSSWGVDGAHNFPELSVVGDDASCGKYSGVLGFGDKRAHNGNFS